MLGEDEKREWVASSEPLISIVPDSLPTGRGRRATWRGGEREEKVEKQAVVE